MTEGLDDWFQREILDHEASLMRFIARTWPRRDEHVDIRQDVYARVYDAARKSRPQAPKAFLFAAARHLMTDRLRRNRIVSIQTVGENEYLFNQVDDVGPETKVAVGQELTRLARAFDQLTDKCREVLWLRRVKELSQRECAQYLGVTEKNVEKHLAIATRQVAQYMLSNKILPRTFLHEVEGRNDNAEEGQ